MAATDFLLLGAGVGLAYYLLRPEKKKETTQELIDIVDVTEDGVIEIPGFKFRSVIEVVPVNMALRSFEEQAAIWAGFRGLINSLTIPCTFLIQTRYLDIRDYINELVSTSKNLPGAFSLYGNELTDWLNSKIEGKTLRDRKYFCILKTDANSITEDGIRVESEVFDTALKSISNVGKTNLSSEGIRQHAWDQLNEMRNIILGSLTGIDITAYPLDKKAVLDMLYQTFNKDSASFYPQTFDETPVLYPTSATPEIVLQKLE